MVTAIPTPTAIERERAFVPYGAAADLICGPADKAREVVLAGPAGTGKSRAALEYVHKQCLKYAGARALILRKTLTSLTSTGLVTFGEKVLDQGDRVRFYGGSKNAPAAYRYPNRTQLVVGGLDKASKILSAEYDLIYVQQVEELTEEEWETLTTRLRNGVMPVQQIVGDCNPGPPTHWLKRRADQGRLLMLESRHEDNPTITPEYLATLDALTGVRKLRYRFGIWAAAEGMVYEDAWDRARNIIAAVPLPALLKTALCPRGIPVDWPRFWSVDFGYSNPFVWQAWAMDPDGRLYRYREIYRTRRLVEDHARDILRATEGEPLPRAIICDHDAEGRATLEAHLGMPTFAAVKAVRQGIQAVAARMAPQGDGRPRVMLVADALVERDAALAELHKPTCTEEEVEAYVWDRANGRSLGEEPLKRDDHGMDAMRYMVATYDLPDSAESATIVYNAPHVTSAF